MKASWRGLFTTAAAVAGSGVIAFSSHTVAAAETQQNKNKSKEEEEKDTLKLVQVVFRHGARTPLSSNYWPALVKEWDVCGKLYDAHPITVMEENGQPRPVNEHDAKQVATVYPGNCHKGELTREGQRQARSFGRYLRQRYGEQFDCLPDEYTENSVYGRTTNYSRTIATLQGVLTGLFPGSAAAASSSSSSASASSSSISIPVYTTEEMDEVLFGNPESCRRLKSMIKRAVSAANEALTTPEIRDLQHRVRTAMDLAPDVPIKFLDLHDALTTMQAHGKPIPEAIKNDPELRQAIEQEATERFMNFIVGDQGEASGEILKLGLGRLISLIVERMEQQNKSSHKMYLYSAHDSTIMPLLTALGQPPEQNHWPIYLSNIVFELWEKPSGVKYVRVLYNKEPMSMPCGGGGEVCSLKALRDQVLGPYLITKREREAQCLVHFSHDLPAGENVKEVTVGSAVSEE